MLKYACFCSKYASAYFTSVNTHNQNTHGQKSNTLLGLTMSWSKAVPILREFRVLYECLKGPENKHEYYLVDRTKELRKVN